MCLAAAPIVVHWLTTACLIDAGTPTYTGATIWLASNSNSVRILILAELFLHSSFIYTVKKIISLHSDVLAVISVALALIFVLVAQAPRQAIAAQTNCQVCHNGTNPHTITIPCNKVDAYLAQHPADSRGPCSVTNEQRP